MSKSQIFFLTYLLKIPLKQNLKDHNVSETLNKDRKNKKITIRKKCFETLWWSRGESNPRPRHCERRALPTELRPPVPASTLIEKN